MRLALLLIASTVVAIGCSRFGRGKHTDGGAEGSAAVASASSSAPDAPSEPGVVPVSDPACVLKAENVAPAVAVGPRALIKLRAGGKAYASLEAANEIEVRFATGASGGTATLKTKIGSFAGEARLGDIPIVAKKTAAATPPWLVVHAVHPERVDADKVAVKMWVPQAVQAVMPLPQAYPCADLAIGVAPPDPPGTDVATLKKESELKTDNGEVIAKLVLPRRPPSKPGLGAGAPGPSTFAVLERAGKKTKVRILGIDTSFEGWVESAVLAKKTPTQSVGMMGLTPPAATPPIRVRCTEAVGVYVDDGERTLRVGTLDANALIESTRTDGVRSFIDLGAHSDFASMLSGEEVAHPYVRSKSIAQCPNATN